MKAYAKITKGLSLSIILCLGLTACGHEHTFTEANCTTPMTCTECGEIQGEALGHAFVEATCETTKTCSVCNITEGEALGHKWIEATTEAPKTCELCGLTEGEKLVISDSDNANQPDIQVDKNDPDADTGKEVGPDGIAIDGRGVDLDGDNKISNWEYEIWEEVYSATDSTGGNTGSTQTPPGGGSYTPGPTGEQGGMETRPDQTDESQFGTHWGTGDYSGLEGGTVY